MALLPSRTNYHISAVSVLNDIKKGGIQERNDFIWLHQERVYAIALIATDNPDHAQELTVTAFKNAFASLDQKLPKKDSDLTIWEWLSDFIVDACAEYHAQNSGPQDDNPEIDPASDGSANMDWETTVLLGVQRIKRCLGNLPEDQKGFLSQAPLRPQLHPNFFGFESVSRSFNGCLIQSKSTNCEVFRSRLKLPNKLKAWKLNYEQ